MIRSIQNLRTFRYHLKTFQTHWSQVFRTQFTQLAHCPENNQRNIRVRDSTSQKLLCETKRFKGTSGTRLDPMQLKWEVRQFKRSADETLKYCEVALHSCQTYLPESDSQYSASPMGGQSVSHYQMRSSYIISGDSVIKDLWFKYSEQRTIWKTIQLGEVRKCKIRFWKLLARQQDSDVLWAPKTTKLNTGRKCNVNSFRMHLSQYLHYCGPLNTTNWISVLSVVLEVRMQKLSRSRWKKWGTVHTWRYQNRNLPEPNSFMLAADLVSSQV